MIGVASVVVGWIAVFFARDHLPFWQWLELVAITLWCSDLTAGNIIKVRQK